MKKLITSVVFLIVGSFAIQAVFAACDVMGPGVAVADAQVTADAGPEGDPGDASSDGQTGDAGADAGPPPARHYTVQCTNARVVRGSTMAGGWVGTTTTYFATVDVEGLDPHRPPSIAAYGCDHHVTTRAPDPGVTLETSGYAEPVPGPGTCDAVPHTVINNQIVVNCGSSVESPVTTSENRYRSVVIRVGN